MAIRDSEPEVPTWVGALQFGVGLFVVYLLYRFVVAVETIAEKM